MKQTFEEAVEKTVNFWVEKSFKTPLNQNNGDDSSSGGLAFLLMNMNSMNANDEVTDEKIELFKKELTNSINEKGEGSYIMLEVDYHPNRILSEAASKSGIPTGCFPVKTFSRIEKDNKVFASYQYRGELLEL